MEVNGRVARIRSAAVALQDHAIGYVSEDRKREGVILQHGVLANTGITIWWRQQRWPVLERLAVKTPSPMQPVASISAAKPISTF